MRYLMTHKELNVRQRRWVRLIKNYDCIIDYHPGKANDVADVLNLKNKFVMDESMDWNKKEWVELKTKWCSIGSCIGGVLVGAIKSMINTSG